ncbi:MAG: site-specific integrase [bacterium]|nr:site-specific integrase [bacterium]
MGLYKRGDAWYIDYYVNGKRKRERVGSNKKVAEQALAKRQVQVAEHRFLDIQRSPRTSLEELIGAYLEYAKANKLSWQRDVHSIQRLKESFGRKLLSEITPLALETYKSSRLKVVAPATVNRELACLKHMFTKAIQWQMATSNPVRMVRMLKEHNQRLRYLTNDEIQLLMNALPERVQPVVQCALYTGMRRGELLNLKWADVDLKQRLLFVRQSKNGEKREIPIAETLLKVLNALERTGEYVFSFGNGNRMRSIREAFDRAVKRCGILNYHFHDNRHTFASYLVMAGVDLLTVKELMGHKSITMTLRYAHLSPDHKRKAIESLDYCAPGHRSIPESKTNVS